MAENITKNSSQSSAAAAAGSKGLTSDQFKVIGFTQEEANKLNVLPFPTGRMHGEGSAKTRWLWARWWFWDFW